VVREVEAIGGNVQASASREQMGYTFDALKTYVPEMVELLVDIVRNPAFLDWEVNEQVPFLIFMKTPRMFFIVSLVHNSERFCWNLKV
jgi:hypothetical protein